MKKIIALMLVLCMAFAMVACGGEKFDPSAKSEGVMTYADYDAAAIDAEVTIEGYVQATQSWWEDKITVYAADPDGAYFIYELKCSEEDSKKLTPGTKIKVTGEKAEWDGEIEIMNGTFEFADDLTYVAPVKDVTSLLGTEELIKNQNAFVLFKGMTVVASQNDAGEDVPFTYAAGTPGKDIYIKLSYNGQTYDFCVEQYLTGKDTEVYKAVEALKIGDVIDVEGYLYWWNGMNPHITKVTK